ncbi:MAG: hypothetical protein IIB58_02500 [Planctomycetes bacterium]|nr:hypothetical protein [Planctomycetota bacterium]
MKALILVAALGLAACAPTQEWQPTRGRTQAIAQCTYEARAATPSQGTAIAFAFSEAARVMSLESLCMKARGFRLVAIK